MYRVYLTCVCRLVFFFFFQAEDGIRDVAVTGVQTCALPISNPCQAVRVHRYGDPGPRRGGTGQRRGRGGNSRSEEHTSELQSRLHLVCRLLLEKKKKERTTRTSSKAL